MSFFIHGPSALEERDFYQQPDPKIEQKLQPAHLWLAPLANPKSVELSDRVTNLTKDPRKQNYDKVDIDFGLQDVDGALIVSGSTSAERTHNIGFWQNTQKSYNVKTVLAVIGAVVAAIAGVALIAASITLTGGLVLLGVAAAAVALAILAKYRSNQAKDQAAQWKFSAGEIVAKDRTYYYQEMMRHFYDTGTVDENMTNKYCDDILAHFLNTYRKPASQYGVSAYNGLIPNSVLPASSIQGDDNGASELRPLLPPPPLLSTPAMLTNPKEGYKRL